MEERWICNCCGREFAEPTRYYTQDDGYTATVNYRCPFCASDNVEELDQCPTCDGGWKRKNDRVCEKCHLQNVNIIKMFVRKYNKATLSDMDDILDGEALENFQ